MFRQQLNKMLAAAFALAMVLLLGGMPPANAQKVLRYIPDGDLKILDPIWTTGNITRNHGYMVYDTLFAVDANFKPQPQMVDTWTVSPDGLLYTFNLREGLLFHDMTPVRSADCVASIKRWAARDTTGQKMMQSVASMAVVNDRTFTIQLKEPYGFVLDSLARISNTPFIMREKEALTDPNQQITEVIGSGPFRFVKESWVPGSKAVYEKFAAYKPRTEPANLASGGKVVKVDRVEWLYMPDPNGAVAALISGEVDWFEVPPPDIIPTLARAQNVKVTTLDPIGSMASLRPNHMYPPFNNEKARQALLYMVDQQAYMQAVAGAKEYWRVCPSFFTCGTPTEGKAPGDMLVKPDYEKARALLKESGYDGRPIVVLDPTDQPFVHQMALITAQNLRQIGANVQVRAMDWSTLLTVRASKEPPERGGWSIFHTWSLGVDIMSPLLNTPLRATGEKAWFGWPDDASIETLKEVWAKAPTPQLQKAAADNIQKRGFEFVTHVPIGQFTTPTAYRTSVSGIIPSPVPFLWNVEKK